MKSVLRATALLSSSSLVSILVGLVSAKALAIRLGTEGVGYMGLLQSLVGLVGLLSGMGLSVGLVRQGASALGRASFVELAALRKAAWLLCWAIGGGAALLMIMLREPISRWMLGDGRDSSVVALMSLTLLLNLASGVQTSILNTYHRVGKLARYGALNSLLGAIATLSFIWVWGDRKS
ncbi:MAG: oligosaccharide flippase family protein, partial [Oscillochloris sp.]|nr:oligosaccharide flippase family protein [Oscillochloris sp.]